MKIIRNLVLYIVICLILTTGAFAVNSDFESVDVPASVYSENVASVEEVEEVEWYFMPIDGVMHMRLWSYTRGVWLTDWIPCE